MTVMGIPSCYETIPSLLQFRPNSQFPNLNLHQDNCLNVHINLEDHEIKTELGQS